MRISDWSPDVCSADLFASSNSGGTIRTGARGGPAGAMRRTCSRADIDAPLRDLYPSPFAPSLSKGRSFLLNAERKNSPSTSSGRTGKAGWSLFARDLAHRKGAQMARGFENLAIDLVVVDQDAEIGRAHI